MKFTYLIGNPPYQKDVQNEGDRANPVYNIFMEKAYEIADCVELITPARFLFDAGQTPKAWNQKMLNDPHLKVLYYNADPKGVFQNTEIKGGVAVTLRNVNKEYGPIKVFTKYDTLNRIINSVFENYTGDCLDSIISPRGTYRLTNAFFTDFPFAKEKLGKGTGNMIASNFFEKIPEAWQKDDGENFIGILSRVNGKRMYCYIKKNYIIMNEYINGFNVASPKSNGNGVFGEALTSTEIIPKGYGATDTFINIGSFQSKYEAESLTKYIKSKFLRTMLGIKKVTQDNSRSMWNMIPLQDFTISSDIDWSKSISEIDQQLYKKYKLSQEEIDFIESHVKEME